MSNFLTVRLRRFVNDDGFTGTDRDLRFLGRTTSENMPIDLRQSSLNDPNSKIRIFLEEVILDVSPTITESRSSSYADEGLPAPNGIVVFEVVNNRKWSISARFVSRNIFEADTNFHNINLLKSWMIPQSSVNNKFGRPPILRLNGYKEQFSNIPVVLTNITINYPEDVDYIEGALGMVPIIQSVEFELTESHSLVSFQSLFSRSSESEEFDLVKFKQGNLPGY